MSRPIAEEAPFVKILPMVVAGIVLCRAINVPIIIVVALWVVATTVAAIFHRKTVGSISAAAAVLLTALIMTDIRSVRPTAPLQTPLEMILHITDNPSDAGSRNRCYARLERFRTMDTDWQNSSERIIVYADTSQTFAPNGRYLFVGQLSPLANEGRYKEYAELMRRRGFTACCFIGGADTVEVLPYDRGGARAIAARLQRGAIERFDRLGLSGDGADIAKAMAFGWRGSIDRELKEEYARSGTAHLLAVSGLHVGIVVMLLNVILYLLPALGRQGHLLKNLVAVAVIWLYALLTGATPSVLRAAAMFTGLQAGLAYGGERSAPNILFAVASLMLLVNPNNLYDISFQLSFIAVAGIAVGFPPLMRSVESRSKLLNLLWGLFIVGLCSSVATAPITACRFGRLPLAGIFVNPVVVVLANIIVLLSLVWSAAPIAALRGLFGSAIGFTAELQNTIVGWLGTQKWAAVDVSLPAWAVIAVYMAAATALITAYSLKNSKKEWKLKR